MACCLSQILEKSFKMAGSFSAVTTVALFFMMPAFRLAMACFVVPRYLVWSRLMLVMTAMSGSRTLVASSSPPMPTSTTAMSTFCSAKYRKARAVENSKKVGCRLLVFAVARICLISWARVESEILELFILMRSLKE